MPKFAPICILPYRRLDHLKLTIEALKQNPEAKQSDLFLFSDGPAPGDETGVAKVRHYLRTITGFHTIEIVERETNNHPANAYEGEIRLLNTFGRVITLEDDIVVAPSFLGFINEGLDRFEDDERIFAICGYTPSMRLEWATRQPAILSQRFSAWGYGYWKRSREKIPRRIEDFAKVSQLEAFRLFQQRQGDDLIEMLGRELNGELDAADVRNNYVMARDDLRVVCPTISLTRNIGFDNSGEHCPETRRFETDPTRAPSHTPIPETLADDPAVFELLRRFRSSTWRNQPWRDDEIIAAIEELRQQPDGARLPPLVEMLPPEQAHRLGDGIVFLLGLPRSGTTLLQRLIGAHPDIHTTAEPWLLLPACNLLSPRLVTADYDAALAAQGVEEFAQELPGGRNTLLDGVRQLVADLYRQCRSPSGARYFLDKTPRYHYIVPELKQLFPLAKFVVLLRNPLGILASVAESWFNGSVSNALASPYHQRDLTLGFAHLVKASSLLGPQAHVLQYETLVQSPETELSKLCEFLNIAFTPEMLHYNPAQRFKGAFGDDIGIPRHSAASTESIDKWQTVLFRPNNILAARNFLDTTPATILSQFGQDVNALRNLFSDAIKDLVLQGELPFDVLPASQALLLADRACDEGEQAIEAQSFDEAAQKFDAALSFVPEHTRSLNNIGVLWWINQAPENALAFFGRAHQTAPDDRTALLNLTAGLTAQGHVEQARNTYLDFMMRHPDDHEVAGLYLSLENTLTEPHVEVPPAARAPIRVEDFAEYAISRKHHFAKLGLPPMHAGANIDDCDLKVYQDMLTYWFILDNFPPGARLLEIGGGHSRIIDALHDRYEFWNMDKFEGAGNGPTEMDNSTGHRVVQAYIGDFSSQAPTSAFDGVFSISTLEHVPQDSETLTRIKADIDRLLKPGGLSLHCVDIVLRQTPFIHPLIPFLHAHCPIPYPAMPFWSIRFNPDLWHMQKSAYIRNWQPIVGKSFERFGRPASYNLAWRKPNAI